MRISIKQRAARVGMLGSVLVATGLYSAQAPAQEEDTVIFEEIVVVAQKREQNIMDVPVAVSAISGQQITDAGIKNIRDLQQNVPNLIIGRSQTATTTSFNIRGIGTSSNNFGLESAVGLYVDGVYRSRQSSMINELIDVEAVEVLRGPQGTLFGKNTPAGAVQIRTVAPSQSRDAFIDVTAGDLGLVRVSAATNIPINDDLAFRGSIFSSQRDGYVDDVNLGDDLYNDVDRIGGRLQLMYEPSDEFNLRIIADYAEIDELCCGTVTLVDGLLGRQTFQPGSDALLLQLGALAGLNPVFFTDFWAEELLSMPPPNGFGPLANFIEFGVGPDDYRTAYNFAPESKNEDSGLSVEFNKTFDNGLTLTSISAYRSFETFDNIDLDFTNVPLGQRINDVEQESFSQELRLAGDFGDGGNFVVGAYYFGQEIDQITLTNGGALLEPYLTLNPSVATITGAVNGLNETIINADPLITLGDLGYPTAGIPFPLGTFSRDDILQDHDGWAVFGQVEFPLGDDFVFTLGARYTDETKDFDAVYTQNVPLTGSSPDFEAIQVTLFGLQSGAISPVIIDPMLGLLPNPDVLSVFLPFGVDGWGTYAVQPIQPRPDIKESLSDDQTTGTAKLTWFPTDSSMVYLSYASGFKSGGTNTERISPEFDIIFQAETADSLELGFKGDLGSMRVGLTLYHTTFDDFQESAFTGTGFNLQNAGKIENKGFEFESLWRPLPGTEFQLIYTHNEGEFESFEAGTCWDGYTFHTGIPDPGLPPNLSAIDIERCDKTGSPIGYNPEDRVFAAITQDIELSNSMSAFVRLEYSWASEQFRDGDLDPFTLQDSFSITNARFGLNFYDWDASLTFWGRNITDTRYYSAAFDAPVQVGRMNTYPAEPRTWGATFRMNFE